MTDKIPQANAMPGIHDFMESYIVGKFGPSYQGTILDAGSGQGAFTYRLKKRGFQHLAACDLYPEQFCVEGVECRGADITQSIPWADNSVDVVLLLEVTEHVDAIRHLFQEAYRVLKPGGFVVFSTPNILSIKSRLRFLLSGYYYSFNPLYDVDTSALWAHVTPYTLDQYVLRLREVGFAVDEVTTDKWQKSSRIAFLFYPLIWLYTKLKFKNRKALTWQNSLNALLGRILVVSAKK
ncbi:methyltransferase domain-containing protein [bacterium]|nr:methyltransferase domain-containing protein [bacterium]